MKKFLKEFLFRGLICAAGGPVVLAIIYGILGAVGVTDAIAPKEVCLGILTITVLAFMAAGMTAVYQLEQLPLPIMILLHGGALYIAYLMTYLVNNWLERSLVPILIFTGIFVVCFAIIWLIIYFVEKSKAEKLNRLMGN
ncbi:MAG: DUF3021 domain-containing protein [Ruminococcaceae bacterium]|nr:DUF3021 domain-containing protein [Oscillospiraceae bacterium]